MPPSANTALVRYDLPTLWTQAYGKLPNRNARISVAGRWRRQEIMPYLPIEGDHADMFAIHLPHGTTMGRDVANFMSKKDPGIRRLSSPGPVAERLAQRIEAFLGGCVRELRTEGQPLWDAITAHAIDDGEFGLLVVPRPAAWASMIDFEVDDGTGNMVIAPRWRRTGSGALYVPPPDDSDSEASEHWDRATSSAAFQDYLVDYRAKRLPFSVQVLPHDMCIPLGLDPDGTVSAMLVRSQRTVTSLRNDGFDFVLTGPALPGDSTQGDSATNHATWSSAHLMHLYELYVNGMVLYQLSGSNGAIVQAQLDGAEAIGNVCKVDLTPYGITGVPGGYFYGSHWGAERDPDKRGYPFIWPYIGLQRGADQLLAQITAQGYNEITNAWLLDPTGVDSDYWTENGKPITMKLLPNSVNVVPGHPTPAQTHAGSEGQARAFETVLEEIKASDIGGLLNGQSGENGFDTSVKMAGAQGNISQIVNGCVAAYTKACEMILRITEALSGPDHLGEPVAVYASQDPTTHQYRGLTELSPDDIDGDYSVDIYFPTKKGSNLPLAQAMHEWKEAGSISEITWLEDGVGDENPEKEVDRIWVQQYLSSEEGTQRTNELIAKYSGDAEMQRIAALRAKGLLTPGGLPSVLQPARPALPAQGQQQGAPTGGGTNPAQQSLNGMMGGPEMAAPTNAVVAATGGGPETATP